MRILLRNGRVIDPSRDLDDTRDVLIEEGKIAKVDTGIPKDGVEQVYDLNGLVVAPGFIDMHVHLREPGREDKETIESGGMAAAAGGFSSVACMPNTTPVNDDQSVTDFILTQAAAVSPVNIFPVGAVSKGLKGQELSEIGSLVRRGCVAISDDGMPVQNGFLMRMALEYARMFDIPVLSHAEDLPLAREGVMNEGAVSTRLGMKGHHAIAEESMVYRDIRLAEVTGAKVHIAHISTRSAIELVRIAKNKGIRVTSEATPHHFALTDEAVAGYDTNTKMKPPLRTEDDRLAVVEGLKDGTIDAVASDHAPHCSEEKQVEFDLAPFGIVGLETSVSLGLDKLVGPGFISMKRFVELYSTGPARVLNLDKGTLAAEADADITVFSPDKPFAVDPARFRSKSRNTPFGGETLKGSVLMTIVSGKVVHSAL
jgi:dihydroorotase